MQNPSPIKKLGQHFLKNERYLTLETNEAAIQPNEVVLEIGPGPGALTGKLLEKATKVIAVEVDKRMVTFLQKKFSAEIENGKLEIIEEDILKAKLPKFDKCVSNVPYQISSAIIELLAEHGKFSVLIIQKEFADRLIAEAGERDYSRLTILANYHFTPVYLEFVPKGAFSPPPKVDSAIVKLVPKRQKPEVADEKLFFELVKALFIHRNQKVSKSFVNSRHFFKLEKDDAKELASKMPEEFREKKVYEMDLYELAELSNWLKELI